MSDVPTKTFMNMTPGHAFGALGIVAMLSALQPVKAWFYTREEGKSIEMRVERIEVGQKETNQKIENLDLKVQALGATLDNKMNETRKELSLDIVRSEDQVIKRMSEILSHGPVRR